MMQTYKASVRVAVKGRTQLVKSEVRAINAQEARWLLWAQYGFLSIQSGSTKYRGISRLRYRA
jgi:Holliday junction resolvase-like predicted endonuclease